MKKKPVFDFLGYRLLTISFHRENDELLEYFKVRVPNNIFDPTKNQYTINIEIEIKYFSLELSIFTFDATYQINDIEWKKSIQPTNLNSMFFSGVFPYIRSLLNEMTNDARGLINVPVLDLRFADLKEGIVFTPNINN